MAAEWGLEWAPSFRLSTDQMNFTKAEPKFTFRIEDGDEVLGIDAQTAGSELDRIRRRDGTIKPAAVVDEARPEDAPLHPAFEWRDPVAAEQWREHQASTLIKVVRVIPSAEPETRMAAVRPVTQATKPVVERYDPMTREIEEAVGSVVEASRKVEQLKLRTQRAGDRRSMMALDVAFKMLEEAREALTNGQLASTWNRQSKAIG
jgi:DNA-directed RNA polymerase subunit H (RpoH/RPB5)